jgi:N6-L-threonylcarbamoyladenine synthase
MVGIGAAKALAVATGKPIYAVNHLVGHVGVDILERGKLETPTVALLVSGGHTSLLLVRDLLSDVELLGETIDDAAGEAFDKSAKLLGLGYPGGPAISRLAESGDPSLFELPRPMLHSKNLDFSFSGLKTAVLTLVKKQPGELSDATRAAIARAFVDAIVEVLVAKCLAAVKQTGMKRLVIAGGVGANSQLRQALNTAAAKKRFEVFYPELALCTDNGAMIALAGALRIARHPQAARFDYGFNVKPRWPLDAID